MIRKENPILLSIINKAIDDINYQQHQAIRDKWITIDVDKNVDYTIIYQIIVVFFSVFIAVLYFLNSLLKANKTAVISNDKLTLTVTELIETQTQLNGTIEHLKSTQQQLIAAEKMASLGNLVAGIAHEINTPIGIGLTGISHFQMITTDLKRKYDEQTMRKTDFESYLNTSVEAASLIHDNLERTAQLVRSFKQISVDQSSDEMRTFNFNEYINQTLVSINSALKHKNLTINVLCDESISIRSYPGAISQIITNLVLNASIHAFDDTNQGVVIITVFQNESHLGLSVKDNGKGISDIHLKKIFDPFYTTNRENGGSGLGLNIIYNIVTNQLNGSITCKSELQIGSEFIIKFTPDYN